MNQPDTLIAALYNFKRMKDIKSHICQPTLKISHITHPAMTIEDIIMEKFAP